MVTWQDFRREANLIGGDWVGADSGAVIEVTNPASGEVIGTVPASGRAGAARAIGGGVSMMRSWTIRRHWPSF